MRLYTFTNFYLSPIQHGIQSAHVLSDMFVKYKYNHKKSSIVYDWAEHHKTMIVLNGGANVDLQYIDDEFEKIGDALIYPFTQFYEDKVSLNNLLTCVGIVLPKEIYDAISYEKMLSKFEMTNFPDFPDDYKLDFFYHNTDTGELIRYRKDSPEWKVISILKSCGLAR